MIITAEEFGIHKKWSIQKPDTHPHSALGSMRNATEFKN